MSEDTQMLKDMLSMQKDAAIKIEGIQKAQSDYDEKSASISAAAVDAAKMAVADSMKSVQDMKEQLDKQKGIVEAMQKMAARRNDSGADTGYDKDMEAECKSGLFNHIRHGTAGSDISAEAKDYMCRSLMANELVAQEKGFVDSQVKSMVAGINPSGGYFIRPEISNQILTRQFETSPIRQLANTVTTATDSIEYIIDDNDITVGGWVGEVDDRDDTGTKQIGKLTIPINELYAQPLLTQKMIDDAGFDVESWVQNQISNKFGRVENTAFVIGDGSEKPQGFLTLPAWDVNGTYQRNAIEQVASGAAASLTGDGLIKLQNSLLEYYQSGAVFGMRRATFAEVMTYKNAQNDYLLNPNVLKQGDDMILLGKRTVFMDDMPQTAANSLPVVYGNFADSYTIADRMGIRLIRDDVTLKPYIKLYTTKRVGGKVTNFQGLKIQKVATS